MSTGLMQGTAVLYLAAALGLLRAGAIPPERPWGGRGPRIVLCAGLLTHAAAIGLVHELRPTPPLVELSAVASLCAWLGACFAACFLRRGRLETLAAAVCASASAAALGASFGSVSGSATALGAGGGWPHLHVILTSAGVAALGVAGLAGTLFLIENDALKRRRPAALLSIYGGRLPPLEALDRVNGVALAVGFPLLTVGAASGLIWSRLLTGRFAIEGVHGVGAIAAWLLYTVLVLGRFGAGWRGRRAAWWAAGGGALLLLTVASSGSPR